MNRFSTSPFSAAATLLFLAGVAMIPHRKVLYTLVGVDFRVTTVFVAVAIVLVVAKVLADRRAGRPAMPVIDALDLSALVLFAYLTAYALLGGRHHAEHWRAYLVEVRLPVLYLLARGLGLSRAYPSWSRRLLLVSVPVVVVIGLVDYFVAWGTLRDWADVVPMSKFWKRGIPRLYSTVVTPAGTAFFLYLGVVAAAAEWHAGARRLPALAVLATAIAMPLTLVRTALACTTGFVLGSPVLARGLRGFVAMAVASSILSAVVLWAAGVGGALMGYGRASLIAFDGSAAVHMSSLRRGLELLATAPGGFGFGQAGKFAINGSGVLPFNETYYVTLGVQAGVPAVLAVLIFFAIATWHALRGLAHGDRAMRANALACTGLLAGALAGSMLLPVASKGWLQLVLCSWLAVLVRERQEFDAASRSA